LAKYHLSEDGTPRLCKAEVGDCPLAGADEHFGSRKEAAAAFEQAMETSSNATVSSETRKLTKELRQLFGDEKAATLPLSTLRQAGSVIETELLRRLNLDSFPENPSKVERDSYSREISLLLKELDSRGEKLKAKLHGPLAKDLRSALTVLPESATARVKNDIHTKKINLNNRQQDGFHVAQAEIYAPPEPTTHGSFMLGEQQEGDYMISSNSSVGFQEVNDESYSGFAIDKLVRMPKPLAAGDSVLDYTKLTYRPEKLIIDLVNDGVLDGSCRLVEGREAEFSTRAPEWAKAIENSYRTVHHYAGKPPTGRAAGGSKYSKIADSFTVTSKDGSTQEVKRPLYELQEKSLSYNAHTVAAKVYPHGSSPSILLHEFTHAVQSQPGGIPGEKEYFHEVQKANPKIVNSYKYTHYEGLPDDYMGDTGGRELFTRTTEALFYAGNADNDFLLKNDEKAEGFRRWGLGTWAALTIQEN
jgi:hypothetical protein